MVKDYIKRLTKNKRFYFTYLSTCWLQYRWVEGKPPTYKEFALYCEQQFKNPTKMDIPECCYIRFISAQSQASPHISRKQLMALWHSERNRHKEEVFRVIDQVCT